MTSAKGLAPNRDNGPAPSALDELSVSLLPPQQSCDHAEAPNTESPTMEIFRFEIGKTYFGSLACSHGCFPVICTKRSAKCVWFEHATHPEFYRAKRATIREGSRYEMANFGKWLISADQIDDSVDMQFA